VSARLTELIHPLTLTAAAYRQRAAPRPLLSVERKDEEELSDAA
jgi:hypothetical protein